MVIAIPYTLTDCRDDAPNPNERPEAVTWSAKLTPPVPAIHFERVFFFFAPPETLFERRNDFSPKWENFSP